MIYLRVRQLSEVLHTVEITFSTKHYCNLWDQKKQITFCKSDCKILGGGGILCSYPIAGELSFRDARIDIMIKTLLRTFHLTWFWESK